MFDALGPCVTLRTLKYGSLVRQGGCLGVFLHRTSREQMQQSTSMTRHLILVAASTVAPARALPITNPCPSGEHLFRCPTYSFCCPDTAFCICVPR